MGRKMLGSSLVGFKELSSAVMCVKSFRLGKCSSGQEGTCCWLLVFTMVTVRDGVFFFVFEGFFLGWGVHFRISQVLQNGIFKLRKITSSAFLISLLIF